MTEMRTTPDRQLLLVRFSGDITTKAEATRKRFLQRMARNIKDALKTSGAQHTVTRTRDRIFVSLEGKDIERGATDLQRIFGIQSLAPVKELAWDSSRSIAPSLSRSSIAIEYRVLQFTQESLPFKVK